MRVEARRAGSKNSSSRNRALQALPAWLLPAVAGAVLGLVLGLVYAWQISPVRFTNAHPGQLSPGGQSQWLNMAADSFSLNQDVQLAQTRLQPQFFEGEGLAALFGEEIVSAQQAGDVTREQRLQALAQALGVAPGSTASGGSAAPTPQGEGSNRLGTLLMLCGGGMLVLILMGLAAIGVTRMRQAQAGNFRGSGQRASNEPRAAKGDQKTGSIAAIPARTQDDDEDDERDAALDEEAAEAQDEPVREVEFSPPEAGPSRYSPAIDEFVTRYNYGDDGYDMSFSIETAQTEFLGECGVGISDTLNDGSPQQVSAFEVWLFDKDDIRTVTKVLLSEYAWNNEELRSRLTPKGELILAKEGDTIDLETKSLRVRARIREVEYGDNGPADSAYFERLVVELTPQQKG